MKRSVFYVLIAGMIFGAANKVPAQHEHPQHNHHGMAHQTAAGVRLEEKDDVAAQVMALRLGPVDLPAHTDHMTTAQPPDLFWAVPIDGWLVAYHPRLVDVAGNPEPGRLLHHVAFWNTRRSDFLCPNKEEHLFGAGGEMNDWPAVPGYGYRVRKGERIRIETMFHNPTDTSYPQTYLEIRIEYRAGNAAAGQPGVIKSIYPTWFDVMQCGSSGYDLQPGKNVTTGEITVNYAGTLLGVGGHLHDYGRRLVLENLTRKEEVVALDAKLDASGRIVGMPVRTFFDRGGYRLNRRERLRVTATYDNLEGKPLPHGAMGIVVGYFVPDNDTQMAALRRKAK